MAHYNLGTTLAAGGRIDEAIEHYRKALEIKPGYAEAHVNLGNAMAARGRMDEAIEHYREGPGNQSRLRRGLQQPRQCYGGSADGSTRR